MKEIEPIEVVPDSEHEAEEPIEMPGAWVFAMLADLGIGPSADEMAGESAEK